MKIASSLIDKVRVIWFVLFILIFAGYLPQFIALAKFLASGGGDFGAYYLAGKMVISGEGHNFFQIQAQQSYSPLVQDEGVKFLPFFHLPYEALLMIPFAAMEYAYAYVSWNVANLVLLIISLRAFYTLCLSSMKVEEFDIDLFTFTIVMTTSLAFYPVIVNFLNGQDTILFFTLIVFALKFRKRKRNFLAGALLGCTIFKPHLCIPLALGLIVRSKKKFLKGFLFSVLICLLLSLSVIGFNGITDFFQMLQTVNNQPGTYGVNPLLMPNIRGFFERHFELFGFKESISILFWFCGLGFIYYINKHFKYKKKANSLFLTSITIIITLICGVHINLHDFVLLLIPLIVIMLFTDLIITKGMFNTKIAKFSFLVIFFLTPGIYNMHFAYAWSEILLIGLLGLIWFLFVLFGNSKKILK